MTWDKTLPPGSEAANNGDNRIREMKSDLEDALNAQSPGDESIFPGADTANPVYRYRGLKGSTAGRPAAGQYGLYANTTTKSLQRDSGSAWEDIATLIDSGTVMVFYQAAAPTGWTKVVTQNDKALRVVSGSGGVASAGGQGLSNTITLAHSHTLPSHNHAMPHKHTSPVFSIAGQIATGNGLTDWPYGTANVTASDVFVGAGAGGSATHPAMLTSEPSNANTSDASPTMDSQLTDVSLAYIDVILCSKD